MKTNGEAGYDKPGSQSSRIGQLDSIRGLAALTVIVGHVMNFFPILRNPAWQSENWIWFYPPLSAFSASDKAVNMFFVLSGFVLALPFLKAFVNPFKFLIKRIFRIYPVLWIIISLSIIARYVIGYSHFNGMIYWFNDIWSTPLTPGYLFLHYSLIGSFENNKLVPVIWSLIHEMRISIIFPLIMFFILNFRYYWSISIGFALIFFGYGMTYFYPQVDYFYTFIYIQFFIIGALIAQNREICVSWWTSLSQSKKWVVFIMAAILYLFSYEDYRLPYLPFASMINKVLNLAGCGIFIIIGLGSVKVANILSHRILVYIGKLSYSIYLIHTVILVILTRLFWHTLPLGYIIPFAIILSIVLSHFLYRFIELPFIRLGRELTKITGAKPQVIDTLKMMPSPINIKLVFIESLNRQKK
jgi:peptidoglycan/LPS O-acetylase OafA/YrhL